MKESNQTLPRIIARIIGFVKPRVYLDPGPENDQAWRTRGEKYCARKTPTAKRKLAVGTSLHRPPAL